MLVITAAKSPLCGSYGEKDVRTRTACDVSAAAVGKPGLNGNNIDGGDKNVDDNDKTKRRLSETGTEKQNQI